MKNLTSNLLGLALLALGFASMANAQATRTWVSGVGDDANPCSRTAPCKTFAGAISKTAVGGEIDCLDEGGFGQVTITKAITIDCDSGPGGILAGAGNGINISAGTGVVNLRSLNINGISGATNGVSITSAGAVHILDMNIYNCSGSGISVSASATVILTVKDTQIHDCAAGGITTSTSGGLAIGDYDHVTIWNGTNGIAAGNASHVNIHGSTIFATGTAINNNGGGGSTVSVTNNTLSTNTAAIQSIAGGQVGVSGNVIIGSSPVYNTNGGIISTGNDNTSTLNGAIGATNGPAITKI
ncbi:MAG TPA: right-handed parallel beta-helix repeat-containing protein [Bryobacteraceae bacterium]